MARVHRFGPFELRPLERTLSRAGTPLTLGVRALDVLIALVEARGALVTKEQLLQQAWPGLVVEEANVHVQVSALRKLLGAQAIATVAPLGYRFALALEGGSRSPHNLPAERTRFIGRESLLEDAAARLAQTRLLTFSGIGGSGKTRLALRLCALMLDRFPAGVWFVDLAPLDDAAQVPLALARVLGVVPSGGSDVVAALGARLCDGAALVVLDNCEHLIDAAAALTVALLAAGPDLRVLATSREALGLHGESVLPVRPMALPSPEADDPMDSEAVRLFVERAHEARPGLQLQGAALELVADMCRRIDGIPLAIELAAARLRVLAPAQLHALLEERFRLLVGGHRALPRQQTLQAVVQWSWDHISPEEQQLLAALSVCVGGCDLAAAAALAGTAGTPVAPVALLGCLMRLVDQSLLQVHDDGTGADARYTLLETVRQFALERLQARGEGAAVRDRHRDHYLALAEAEAAVMANSATPADSLARQDRERDNLLRALAWCEVAGDVTGALRLVVAMRHYWPARGQLAAGYALTERVLARAGAAIDGPWRLQALASATQLALWLGHHALAEAHAQAHLACANAIGEPGIVALAQSLRAQILRFVGRHDEALALLESALPMARGAGHARAEGLALSELAALRRERGEWPAAQAMLEDMVRLREQHAGPFDQMVARLNAASIAVDLGELERAREHLVRAADLQSRVASRYASQALLGIAAELAAASGEWRWLARWRGAYLAQRADIG